jgi:general secretion pathway protein N
LDGVIWLDSKGSFMSELQASVSAEMIRAVVPIIDIWKPGGIARINASKVALEPLKVVEPATVQWIGASVGISKLAPLGDYVLAVSPDGDNLKLNLTTTNGPLLINGSGQYNLKSGGEFRGKAQAAPGFNNQLAPLMQLMGRVSKDGSVILVGPLPTL